jgi:rfaE bifunctional protein nucleotidyltransferase chain/domain
VDYLEKARQLGDRLVVGLNDDASVRRLKGEDRPLKPVETRARLLAAMEFVDGVVVFAEDTPLRLIETLGPDILVKGGDYQIEEIVGHEFVLANGGQVLTIPLVAGTFLY